MEKQLFLRVRLVIHQVSYRIGLIDMTFYRPELPNAHISIRIYPRAPALLALPGLFFAPPFIFLAEKPLRSPLETASPLLENLFLPPCPYFSSFFCLLLAPPFSRRSRRVSDFAALSRVTSNRSASLASVGASPSCRSAKKKLASMISKLKRKTSTYFSLRP